MNACVVAFVLLHSWNYGQEFRINACMIGGLRSTSSNSCSIYFPSASTVDVKESRADVEKKIDAKLQR